MVPFTSRSVNGMHRINASTRARARAALFSEHHNTDSTTSIPISFAPLTPSSASSSGTGTGTMSSSSPSPPSRRRRRPAPEIDRRFVCGWPGCDKAYGKLNHLNTHIAIHRHGSRRSGEDFPFLQKRFKKLKTSLSIAPKRANPASSGSSGSSNFDRSQDSHAQTEHHHQSQQVSPQTPDFHLHNNAASFSPPPTAIAAIATVSDYDYDYNYGHNLVTTSWWQGYSDRQVQTPQQTFPSTASGNGKSNFYRKVLDVLQHFHRVYRENHIIWTQITALTEIINNLSQQGALGATDDALQLRTVQQLEEICHMRMSADLQAITLKLDNRLDDVIRSGLRDLNLLPHPQ